MNDTIHTLIASLGQRARAASRLLATASSASKNAALKAIADSLEEGRQELIDANAQDTSAAAAKGMSGALLDRLTLTPKRIAAMIQGVREVEALPDPVGEILRDTTRPNGLHILKRRVPIGTIGIIYESRPNVTCDAAVLCLKTGNATLLRGGSEAFASNTAIAKLMARGVERAGLPADAVLLVPTTDREAIPALCAQDKWIDLLIPRGGQGLIETVVRHARMPVIKHYNGICHVFIAQDADPEMAKQIVLNSKCQRPGTCNALETLLVDASCAPTLLPDLAAALCAAGVELRGDDAARQIVPTMVAATEEDWSTEYLDLILSVKIVSGLPAAIDHIERYGSRHSDAIVTSNAATAELFLAQVDSAAVYWNASTRFTDGGEFGFGAEIGISTDKLHARGPMALEELTSYKYQILGSGQVRA